MDPLSQLHDIHLPEQIHQYPLAPGWWLLLLLTLALLTFLIRSFLQYRRLRKVKHQALKRLKQPQNMEEINRLLKWACLHYFPRQYSASLYGTQFQHFLADTLPQKHRDRFIELSTPAFASLYQHHAENEQHEDFSAAALIWLQQALPPRKATLTKLNTQVNSMEVSQ